MQETRTSTNPSPTGSKTACPYVFPQTSISWQQLPSRAAIDPACNMIKVATKEHRLSVS